VTIANAITTPKQNIYDASNDSDDRVFTHFRRRLRRILMMPMCPNPAPAGPAAPPNALKCNMVKGRAEAVNIALKTAEAKQNAEREANKPKIAAAFSKEGMRRMSAWARAKKREEKDIAERMDRARRDNHAHNEERADRIMRTIAEDRQWNTVSSDLPYKGIINRMSQMDRADRLESGLRSERLYENSKQSFNDSSIMNHKVLRLVIEPRGQMKRISHSKISKQSEVSVALMKIWVNLAYGVSPRSERYAKMPSSAHKCETIN